MQLMQGDESDIRRINSESGAVLERLEMPRGTGVSGLESTGQTSFIAAAERAERPAPCDARCAGLMAILLVLGVMEPSRDGCRGGSDHRRTSRTGQ
jgi:hypothetical protein